jgi:enoyl-CoA hydratase/carnithine racemase
MIRGYCFGGGLALALACDLRLAATDARFAIPAAKLGLGYALDGLKTLYDLVGPATAKEMLFTARQFSAEEAVALGLINRLVDVAALEALARDYGTMIASNAPLSIAAAKTALAEFGRLDGPPDRARCEALIERCFQSQDYVEGRRAFVEKRAPRFRGC